MYESVVITGRGYGRTAALIEMIHDLIISDQRPSILVVHPDLNAVRDFHDAWNERYAALPRPAYCYITNMNRARGVRAKYVIIEAVDQYEDGLHDIRLDSARTSVEQGGEVLYTYTPSALSLSSHSARISRSSILRNILRAKPKLDGV